MAVANLKNEVPPPSPTLDTLLDMCRRAGYKLVVNKDQFMDIITKGARWGIKNVSDGRQIKNQAVLVSGNETFQFEHHGPTPIR